MKERKELGPLRRKNEGNGLKGGRHFGGFFPFAFGLSARTDYLGGAVRANHGASIGHGKTTVYETV